ncbi:hypothetical protein COCNU_scaffold061467G000010 [Cocos nucifera]|nr:hypothetical protein [Cocos nucifera]
MMRALVSDRGKKQFWGFLILLIVDAESGYRRNPLEQWPMRSSSGTCKTTFRPELVGDGSGRTLRRSSQLWSTRMECSIEFRGEKGFSEPDVSVSGGSFYRGSLL